MTISKVTTTTNPYLVEVNKSVTKKNNNTTIDSSEKVAKSISVESEMDMGKLARLDNLADQIKNKTFTVSHEAIAEKMLQDKSMINLLLS